MGIEPSQASAGHAAAVTLPMSAAIGFAAAVALVVVLTRRRLPAGLGEGLFVAAISGAALALLAVDSVTGFVQPALGHVLTGLAVLWYGVSRVAAWAASPVRRSARTADSGHTVAEDPLSRRWSQMLAYAGLACGLAALASGVSRPPPPGAILGRAVAVDLVVLALLAALVWFFRTGTWGVYAPAGVLVCSIVLVIPADVLTSRATVVGIGMNIAALASLLVVLGMILWRWRCRRQLWLDEPQEVVAPPPWNDAVLVSLVAVSVLLGVVGLLGRESAYTPTATALAALTCLIVGHLRTSLVAGEVGLILLAESIVTGVVAWLWSGWLGALIGVGLAGGYLLWLARFWDQQLHAGVAWTTAGRLIPVARRLALVAAAGVIVPACAGLGHDDLTDQRVWPTAIATVLLLGFMSLLVRDAHEFRHPGAAPAACLVAAAAAWPGWRLLGELFGSTVSPLVTIAAGASLLALRVATARDVTAGGVYSGYIAGIVPVAVLFSLAWRGLDAQIATGLILIAGAVAVLAMKLRAGKHPGIGESEPRVV